MKTMESVLKEEKEQLEKIINEAQKRIKTAPQGRLRITEKRNKPQYYYKNDKQERSNGRYMKKNETELARGIAQKDYDIQVVKNAEERAKAISTFLTRYENTSLKKVYQQTNPYRRELILAPILSDEEFVRQWLAEKYEGKPFANDTQEIITERGERVRSKSEKIILLINYMH